MLSRGVARVMFVIAALLVAPAIAKGPREKNASDAPESIALGRLNGDSALDVIVGNDSGVDAYINK